MYKNIGNGQRFEAAFGCAASHFKGASANIVNIMMYIFIHTARSSSILNAPSIAAATEGGSTIRSEQPSVMLHRFTLIKPGASGKKIPTGVSQGITSSASQGPSEAGWSPAV